MRAAPQPLRSRAGRLSPQTGFALYCRRGRRFMPDTAPDPIENEPVVALIRAGVRRIYGARLERAVLYGSRARGEARPDSDYDVMVFLRGYRGLWDELQPLSRLAVELFDRTGAIVNFMPAADGDYRRKTGFMHEIRSEGRTV
jgi:predicted nucleotidyltransferase